MDFVPVRRASRHVGQPLTAYVWRRPPASPGRSIVRQMRLRTMCIYRPGALWECLQYGRTVPGADRASTETAPRDGESGPNCAARASADTAHLPPWLRARRPDAGRRCSRRTSHYAPGHSAAGRRGVNFRFGPFMGAAILP
jgi:hypothetical protein